MKITKLNGKILQFKLYYIYLYYTYIHMCMSQ